MALPISGLEDLVDNEDYYSLLNASRQASQEELKNSYRRLCMVYHPDKHDTSNSKKASEIFGKIQNAYSVLSDPAKRHIYDVYGEKGLNADWQLVERQQTQQEMQAEYEKIQRIREQARLEERTHPQGSFSLTVNATSLFDNHVDEDDDYYNHQLVLPDITEMSMTQSIDAPLTVSNTATLTGSLETNNGVGGGKFDVSLRHVMSPKLWTELHLGASDSREFSFNFKGYRSLSSGLFAIAQFPLNASYDDGVLGIGLPGASCTLGRVMSDGLYGTLDLKMGWVSPHLSTSLVRDSSSFRVAGKLQLGIPHSFAVASVTYKMLEEKANLKVAVKAGTFGCMVEYGGEHQLSQHSRISAHVNVGVPLGVSVKIRLNRVSQTYVIPIILCEDMSFVATFYATVLPVAAYAAMQILIIRPYRKRRKLREAEESEQSLVNEVKAKMEEAADLVRMMKESTERKVQVEERKLGLVITEAWYGRFVTDSNSTSSKLVDVTIPLQNLVENSKLQLPGEITKSGLPGFYDPSPGSDKKLKVTYKFRGGIHQATVEDREALRMPLRRHALEAGDADK